MANRRKQAAQTAPEEQTQQQPVQATQAEEMPPIEARSELWDNGSANTAPDQAAMQQPLGMDMASMQQMQQPMQQREPDALPVQVVKQAIGKEQVQEARQTLLKYKAGKANLEQKVIEAEQWYKLRNWECLRRGQQKQHRPGEMVEPVSGWLFNAIENKHADAMDSFPSPNIQPREEGDKQEAETLSAIVPVILAQNDFWDEYSQEAEDKLKCGTGVYGIFWDAAKLNGLGDITVEHEDILSLFWEPGVTDIQDSTNFFHVALRENDLLIGEYPNLNGHLGSSTLDLSRYIYDDSVDTSTKSAVVDWYYKKREGQKTILHYCRFVNDEVLFATENEPDKYPDGWYAHGQYPYVFDPLFRMKGTPCGFGYIDVGKSVQEYIDRCNQAILENLLANTKPRHFIRNDGSVNEEEYADMTRDFVHVDGNLGQDSILPITGKPLNSIYVDVLNDKITELKEVTGNRDVSTGGSTSGVTAASAIAAMQEAGSKLSRNSNAASYRAFRKVVRLVVELIRQFYDLPRKFRITGENGSQKFVEYNNSGIQPQPQGMELGIDMGYRVPEFDIDISAEKESPYSRLSQNEMALQFYNAGFFNPQLADQALACLDMMDFDRKSSVTQKIAQNGTMYQQMMQMQQQMVQMAQTIDGLTGSNLTAALTGEATTAGAQPQGQAAIESSSGESSVTKDARERVANSTIPT